MYLTFYDIASSMGLKQDISKLLPLEEIVVHEQRTLLQQKKRRRVFREIVGVTVFSQIAQHLSSQIFLAALLYWLCCDWAPLTCVYIMSYI